MKLLLCCTAALIFSANVARAQELKIDADLWAAMNQAIGSVSMPLQAHQQIQQILAGVQREAQARAARAAEPAKK